jgi:hypothetical protein
MQLTNVAPASGANGSYINLDTTDRSSRTSTGLLELLQAFDQLKVPVEDQIAIIHELKRTGALHAEIVTR